MPAQHSLPYDPRLGDSGVPLQQVASIKGWHWETRSGLVLTLQTMPA